MATIHALQMPLVSIAQSLIPLTKLVARHLGPYPHVPAFVAFFFQIFVSGVIFWRYVGDADRQKIPRLASYTVSTVHSTICCLSAWPELVAWLPSLALDEANTPLQSLVVQFSLAFMIFDFIYMMAFEAGDHIMNAHHVLAAAYNAGTLYLGRGGISAILPFFMGELATPLFNAFNITKDLKADKRWAAKLFPLASTLFTVAFVLTRSIAAPPIMAWFVKTMWFDSPAIPKPWAIFFGAAVTIGMAGSQLWAYKLVRGWRKMHRQRKRVEEQGDKKEE